MTEPPASVGRPQCPRCGTPLAVVRVAGPAAHVCSTCHGLYLDVRALATVLGELFAEAVRRAAEARDAGAPPVKCPRGCGPMRGRRLRRGRESVHLDACDRCEGIWFDRGEVERVRRAAPPRRKPLLASPEGIWDPDERAKAKVDAADAQLEWAEDEGESSWWFAFMSGLPVEGANRLFRFPLMTWCLIAACCAAFLIELRVGDSIFERFGTIPALFLGQGDGFTRLLVSMFLHGDWLHLLGNMYFLKSFGDNAEDRLGRPAFFFLYLLSGIAADLTHILLNPESERPAVGASGAISGLLGAYLVLFPHARIAIAPRFWNLFQQLRVPAFLYLFVWFLWQIAASELLEAAMVAWGAHVGGFVVGVFLAWIGKRALPDARVASLAAQLRSRQADP